MKKKVLIVTAPLRVGGYDIVATNLQEHLDKNKFECTFYIRGETVGDLEAKAIQNGARIIHKPDNIKGFVKEYKHLKQTMVQGGFDIVHTHLMYYGGLVMRAAYKAGVKKRVPHSHMTNPCMQNRSFIKKCAVKIYGMVMRMWLNRYGTDLIACGPEAGKFLYGKRAFNKRVILLNNAIDLNKFNYTIDKRKTVRQQMELDGKLVIGHIGRLNYVKNHDFLIDVFYEVQKSVPESVLLIVGEGEERKNIEKKACLLGISEKVIITGVRNDVENMLVAIDVLVFPSLYEGLPLALIEAQATKLPCVISDTVSRYAKQNTNVKYLSLKTSPEIWAKEAMKLSRCNREEICIDDLKKNYDIKNIAKQLEEIYLSF